MNLPLRGGRASIVDAIGECLTAVRPAKHGRLEFRIGDDLMPHGTAVLGDRWLVLSAPLHDVRRQLSTQNLEWLLTQNALLPAGIKLTLAGRPPVLHLTADIPHDDHALPVARVQYIASHFQRIVERARADDSFASGGTNDNDEDRTRTGEDPTQAESLADLCHEAGWLCTPRGEQQVAVPLDVPHGFYQAILQVRDGGVVARVALDSSLAGSMVSRQAAGALLLSACGEVRMVRAYLDASIEPVMYGWQILWTELPTAQQLQHSLAALSVACNLTGDVLAALQDEQLAQQYLVLRGWSS